MSATIKKAFGCALALLKPQTYINIHDNIIKAGAKHFKNNSITPLFYFMGATSVTGYVMKYSVLEGNILFYFP